MRRALLLPLLLVFGCPPANVARPYAPPTTDELMAALRARVEHLHSMRADTKVDEMGEGGERVKVNVQMLVERGGKLRLEAESPVGGAVATLVSDGTRFALLDVQHNRFLVGPARPCNIARLIRVELEPEDVVSALLGGAPLDGTPAGVSWDPTHGGREVLALKTPDGGSETISLDAAGRRWDVVAAERKDAAGHVRWRLSHEDFSDHGGFRLPARSFVEDPPHHADVRIRYREVEPNVTPPAGAFQLSPNGLPPQEVGCD